MDKQKEQKNADAIMALSSGIRLLCQEAFVAGFDAANAQVIELLAAAEYAEAIMSEDVLNAVTGDYAADHCIYEAINLLKAAINKARTSRIEKETKSS